MANFPRNGSVHGANGPEYYDHSHQNQQARGNQEPRNTFGITGSIARMISRHANKMAEKKMDYTLRMNEFLEQDQQYVQGRAQYQGPQHGGYGMPHDAYRQDHYAQPPGPPPGMDRTHDMLVQQMNNMQGQIHALEEFLEQALTALNEKISNGGRTPAMSVAGDEGHQAPSGSQRPPRFSVMGDDEHDPEDLPSMRPPLPTTPRPTTTIHAVTSAPEDAAPAQTEQAAQKPQPPKLPRREFPPPPLHPSHPRAQLENRTGGRQAASAQREGLSPRVDIDAWRRSTSGASEIEREEDSITDITSTTSHRPTPHLPRPTRKPLPERHTVPGGAAGTDDNLRNQQALDVAANVRANARLEGELREDGYKTADRITR